MSLRDRPYLPLYVQDFLTDEKLMNCSAAAHGVYIKLMCIMHKNEEYGVLTLRDKYKRDILLEQNAKQNGSKPPSKTEAKTKQIQNFACMLARFLPFPESEVADCLHELIEEDVIKMEGDKLFQKRMIRDADISNKRAAAGSKGGRSSKGDKILLEQNSKQNASKGISKKEANTEDEYEYVNNNKEDSKNLISFEIENLVFQVYDIFVQLFPNRKLAWGQKDPRWSQFKEHLARLDLDLDQWREVFEEWESAETVSGDRIKQENYFEVVWATRPENVSKLKSGNFKPKRTQRISELFEEGNGG